VLVVTTKGRGGRSTQHTTAKRCRLNMPALMYVPTAWLHCLQLLSGGQQHSQVCTQSGEFM
jgi:hypothetical protein